MCSLCRFVGSRNTFRGLCCIVWEWVVKFGFGVEGCDKVAFVLMIGREERGLLRVDNVYIEIFMGHDLWITLHLQHFNSLFCRSASVVSKSKRWLPWKNCDSFVCLLTPHFQIGCWIYDDIWSLLRAGIYFSTYLVRSMSLVLTVKMLGKRSY